VRRLLGLVLISACCLSACAWTPGGRDVELERAGRLVKERRHGEALATYCKIARESPGTERGANALFACASVRASYDNPQRDYALALQEFDEFLRLYPTNEKSREAQNWRFLLKAMLELKKENEGLTTRIEQLKQLDIRQEERRRR
jgi:outer membrane protein assembly factor BamD (BamD/ComL family)